MCVLIFSVELKKQPFFQGVDWHKVADRTSEPPYERTHVQLNQQQPTDVRALFKINEDDELDAIIAEKLRGKLFFFLNKKESI